MAQLQSYGGQHQPAASFGKDFLTNLGSEWNISPEHAEGQQETRECVGREGYQLKAITVPYGVALCLSQVVVNFKCNTKFQGEMYLSAYYLIKNVVNIKVLNRDEGHDEESTIISLN